MQVFMIFILLWIIIVNLFISKQLLLFNIEKVIYPELIVKKENHILCRYANNPCSCLRYLFKMNQACNETCINIIKIGRFGNNFISFKNALILSIATGIKKVFIPKGFLFFSQNFYIRDISVEIGTPTIKCFSNPFFYCHKIVGPFYDQFLYIINDIKVSFLKQFKNISFPNDTLVIYIRSGDIFTKNPHPKYGQPPCHYYQDIINMKNWSKKILIAEDQKNPCVFLISQIIGNFKQRSLNDDLVYLLNAPNLVISKGTFGNAIIALSNKIINIFTFAHTRILNLNYFNCIPHEKYLHTILYKWKNTKQQQKMMINYKCNYWEFFPKYSSIGKISSNLSKFKYFI